MAFSDISDAGLSPRVRGNPREPKLQVLNPGSIPAGAGEPRLLQARGSTKVVYPRGCGGTPPPYRLLVLVLGLSPRVRGNHAKRITCSAKCRSIPAGAGEP